MESILIPSKAGQVKVPENTAIPQQSDVSALATHNDSDPFASFHYYHDDTGTLRVVTTHNDSHGMTHPQNALEWLIIMTQRHHHHVLAAAAFGMYLYALLLPISYGGHLTATNLPSLPGLLMVCVIVVVAIMQAVEDMRGSSSVLSVISMMASGYIAAGVHA